MATKTVKKIKLSSKKTTPKSTKKTDEAKQSRNLNPFSAMLRYVKGSWHELRQVRWPDRRATWGMTIAVILFTLFFSVIILILDGIFQLLFKEILLK